MNILLACAHPDDQTAAAGTLAKLAKQGHKVHTLIFTYGELTHPHLKKELLRKTKTEEAQEANKIIGGKSVEFLGVVEGRIAEGVKKGNLKEKVKKKLEEIKPDKIFTHIPEDHHPDHRSVCNLIMGLTDTETYGFARWSFFHLKRRDYPKAIHDVTETFRTKMEAMDAHKSQRLTLVFRKLSARLKGFITGLRNNYHMAEKFYVLN